MESQPTDQETPLDTPSSEQTNDEGVVQRSDIVVVKKRKKPMSEATKLALARGRREWNLRRRAALERAQPDSDPKIKRMRKRDLPIQSIDLTEVKGYIQRQISEHLPPRTPTITDHDVVPSTKELPTSTPPIESPPRTAPSTPPVASERVVEAIPRAWQTMFGYQSDRPTLRRTFQRGRRPRFY